MKESMFYASEELKRAEHLLYVSLKYTRTTDVIKSLVERLIACFDHVIDGILSKKEEENQIIEVPKTPFARVETLKDLYKDDKKMLNYIEFYHLLRKIVRSKSASSNEFRRNVKMTANVDDKKIELNIDILGDYYNKTVDFLRYVKDMMF